jgi:hypothetical protein
VQVSKQLSGDFVVVAQFGDKSRGNNGSSNSITNSSSSSGLGLDDSNRVLFRYANTAGFVPPGQPLRLSKDEVDVMRLYADGFDESFLMTLIVDAGEGPSSPGSQVSAAVILSVCNTVCNVMLACVA